jgi:hypothetical protein
MNSGASGGSGMLKAIEAVPGAIADGVEDVGAAMGDVASATVSFSERAMQALASGGMAVVHGVEDVVSFPFEMAVDAAVGVEHAVEGGMHLVSSGVHAVIDGVAAVAHGAEAAVHAVAIDLPTAIASDVADVTSAALGNATTLATAATGVALLTGTSPVRMIGAMF